MTYIPGQNDSLFEAVKGVVTGDTEEGTYARNVLGYTPALSESVRVRQVPEDNRGPLRDRVLERMGQSGPPGWKYGQRVYYGGEPFRVVEFKEGVDSYEPLRLTIVRDDFSQEISGVLADYVTYPTHTTAIGEDMDLLDEESASDAHHAGINQMVSELSGRYLKTVRGEVSDVLGKNLTGLIMTYMRGLHNRDDPAKLKSLRLAMGEVWTSLTALHRAAKAMSDSIRKAKHLAR